MSLWDVTQLENPGHACGQLRVCVLQSGVCQNKEERNSRTGFPNIPFVFFSLEIALYLYTDF